MAINVDFYKNPSRENEESGYHARQVSNSTLTTAQIAVDIEKESTLSSTDIKACLQAFSVEIERAILSGYHVKLDGIGTFKPSLNCEVIEDAEGKLYIKDAKLTGLKLIPDSQLLKNLKAKAEIHRVPKPKPQGKKPSPEEQKQLITHFFQAHEMMSVDDFTTMTGLPSSSAYRALKAFETEGIIEKKGTLYILK